MPANVWELSLATVGDLLVTFIPYRKFFNLVPSVTCLPSLVMRIILLSPPWYVPPAMSHLPREIKLFFCPGTCKTFSSFNVQLTPLQLEINVTVPRPIAAALLLPTPVTVLSWILVYVSKQSRSDSILELVSLSA